MNEIILIIVAAAVILLILYFLIKAAVRDGIIEAHSMMNKPRPQTICTQCGKLYDMVFPKCPHCNHWRT